MTVGTTQDVNMKTELVSLDHWSQCLRCTICFCCLRDPHTLDCGHTFCRGCLKRLAEVARADNPDVRRRRLNLACPTCRHQFPAKPVLMERTSVNIAMKNMLELWEKECRMLLTSGLVRVQSSCTQTLAELSELSDVKGLTEEHSAIDSSANPIDLTVKTNIKASDLPDITEHIRPPSGYFEVLLKRVGEFSEDLAEIELEKSKLGPCEPPPADSSSQTPVIEGPAIEGSPWTPVTLPLPVSPPTVTSDDNSSASDTDTSSSSSSNRSDEADQSNSEASLSELVGYLTVPRVTFRREFTLSRLVLIVAWCMYTTFIVGMADTALPYVAIATLFTFLLCLG